VGPPFILVGHSAGALYSRQFAHSYPDLVAGLVFLCPNPAPSALHPTPHTLHPTPYTPRPTLYTLHLTPYTLHSMPYTPTTKPET